MVSPPNIPYIKEPGWTVINKMIADPIECIGRWQKQYGDIFQTKILWHRYIFLCNPKFIEHVIYLSQDNYIKHPLLRYFAPFTGKNNILITNNMEKWKKDRALFQIPLQQYYFDQYFDVIVNKCTYLLDKWQHIANNQLTWVPVCSDSDKLLLDIFKDSIFYNTDINVEEVSKGMIRNLDLIMYNSMFPISSWISPKHWIRHLEGVRFINQTSEKILQSRLSSHKDYDDLLGTYIHEYQVKNKTDANFTVVRDYLKGFLVTGYAPITSALRWILVMLALHPEIQDQIESEIKSIYGNRAPTFPELDKFIYLKAFISEVLRMYPPFSMLLRKVVKNDNIMGYPIPAKSTIIMSPYMINRHPEFWENPNEFDITRFIENPLFGQQYQFAYMSFGVGNRSCPAKFFSLFELSVIVIMLVKQFHFSLPADFRIKIKYLSSIAARPNTEFMYIKSKNL